ncbi:MAG: DUF4160 domain-containing protein [Methylophilaceae bacterium]
MPRVATFAKFALYLYANDHGVAHVHIESAVGRASIAIADGSLLVGDVPVGFVRQARVWIAAHRDELLCLWKELHP